MTKYIPETLDEAGALRLKRIIEAYWKKQKRVVNCRVEKMNLSEASQHINRFFYVVRSDLGMDMPPLAKSGKSAGRVRR